MTATLLPEVGAIAKVRQRQYLVEKVAPGGPGEASLVRMACVDDDAQGEILEALWELEPDARVLQGAGWERLAERGFDSPTQFASYLQALRWNCVTASDPKLFQAPFRAGIRLDAYQLEPLRKALLLPRVNLFIADDVGLGKTIEAGLITRELILRKKVRDVVVACPPSILSQWQSELEQRFGLGFEVLDREYILQVKQERGFATNPWATHSRFLISNRLLVDETYAAPMRDWLGSFRPGSLLILDEAHHAAPSTGSNYAVDSKITRAVRDLAPRFEHRLFLSATPHNGHSNSFSALLEILDPQRFCRGVLVRGKRTLADVMVRRLKEDIRDISGGGFPIREVVAVVVDGLPADAPELRLASLLDEYRQLREQELEGETKRTQAAASLLVTGLQQRLFSSIEAFARTLKVHRRTMEKRKSETSPQPTDADLGLFTRSIDADDDRASLDEEQLARDEESQVEAATAIALGGKPDARADRLLDEMTEIAESARGVADARVAMLLRWIRNSQCPGARVPGEPRTDDKSWMTTRVIVFTEFEATLTYLRQQIEAAIVGTDLADQRIEVFRGSTPTADRETIKRNFNADPLKHPLRILLCTDAAREGINLQTQCADLFHFDVPWNPARMEQRNGRIDRKLQPSPVVRCHYFVYAQRPEDRILKALVEKTETIKRELGSLAQVVEGRLGNALVKSGIRRRELDALQQSIAAADLEKDARATVEEELEAARERREEIADQIDELRTQLNRSREAVKFEDDDARFRQSISCALQMAGAVPLRPMGGAADQYMFPKLDEELHGGADWADTIDTLRSPRERGQPFWEWRRTAKVRPVVFQSPAAMTDEVVHLHLEHPVVKRLLGRFFAQGYILNDLSRACFAQTSDAIPRLLLLGRLCLYGAEAARLHEEILCVAARWVEPDRRQGKGLEPFGRDATDNAFRLLEAALEKGVQPKNDVVTGKLQAAGPLDVTELQPHLEERGRQIADDIRRKLEARGRKEADDMREILLSQKKRIESAVEKASGDQQLTMFHEDERRQLDADRAHWRRRLAELDRELAEEPDRICDVYRVRAQRVEPVGLAYLWPATG